MSLLFAPALALALALGAAAPRLVSLTAERSILRAGATLDPDCCAVLEARVHPPAKVKILFTIAEGTGVGKFLGACLSDVRAATDEHGVARVLLVSSDARETCMVDASYGGVSLKKRFRFGSSAAAAVFVEPPGRGRIRAVRIEEARRLARRLPGPDGDPARAEFIELGPGAVEAIVDLIMEGRESPGVLAALVRVLAEIRSMESERKLRSLLALPGVAVRSVAVRGLILAGEEEVAESLMRDRSPWARASAFTVLAAAGKADFSLGARDPSILVRAETAYLARDEGALVMLLRDESPFVRCMAARKLARWRKGATVLKDALLGAVSDPCGLVRAAAAVALEGDPNLGCLAHDPDSRVRRAAASSLSSKGPLEDVRKFACDPDELAREIALSALAARGNDDDIPLLIGGLESEDERLRMKLLSGLRRMAKIEFPPPPTRQVREWKEWWTEWKGKPRAERLTYALRLNGSSRRGEAALELLSEGITEIGPDLLELLKSPLFENRQDAALALHILGEDYGLRVLSRDLRDRRWFVRARAVEVCRKVGRRALGALVGALDDETPSIRRRVLDSLTDLTGRTFGFKPEASAVERQRAINRWREFLRSQRGEG